MSDSQAAKPLPPEILSYYERTKEAERLLKGAGRLEFLRTQEILRRYLPKPHATICDVGGGTGLYSYWIAALGHEVHLIDASPLHIDQARSASSLQPDAPITSFTVGDARQLQQQSDSADAVLLLGPLYHLTERSDRLLALREARRILKPGGVLFCAAISRFASALDGLLTDALLDSRFAEIVRQDLENGQHRNPHADRDYFTTAYLHHPSEFKQEVEEAFQECQLLAIEGPGWLLGNFDAWWQDENRRNILLAIVRTMEAEPSLMGASAHFIAVAHK